MDVGHVILGRPWLYDKDVTNYDQLNMCQFEHEGKKIKLLPREPKVEPSEPKPTIVKKTNSINLITSKAFNQDVEKGAPFVILVTKKITKESNITFPPKVTPVIAKSADIFLKSSRTSFHRCVTYNTLLIYSQELVFSICPTIG